jgi:hypothetical protein
MGSYQDFQRGRLNGLSLTIDGRLVLGPKIETVFTSDQPEIWSVARGPDGSLYLGTGNRGRVYKLDPSGKSTLLWTADRPEIFAVSVDSKGVVYAGTSPNGKVYRIEDGKVSEYFAPDSRYIWALATGRDGALFVATGDQGKIFRVTGPGKGELYYETGQAHVTSLTLDSQGRLLAGSEPNGILYRIAARGRAFVLYDSSLPEIRAIAPGPDGAIYAAALGGSIAKRTGAAASSTATTSSSAVPTFSTSITVTDQQAGVEPPKPEAPKSVTPAAASAPAIATTASGEYTGVERSALYKIHADNTVETLWSSKEENLYDLAFSGSSILLLTDAQGRIYRLDPDRKITLLAQANEGDATRLLASPNGILAATGNLGRILRLSENPGSSTGWFESAVHDSGSVARWGRIAWRGSGRGLAFRTRSGNTARPDATWSEWSDPISDPERSGINSPNARYIQWRAEFTGARGNDPAPGLDRVTVAYLPQNTPPIVRSVNVSALGSAVAGTTAASTAASSTAAAYSITVTDTVDTPAAAGTPSLTIRRPVGQQIQISWQAEDPDGDRLLYSLYFRGDDETRWKLLRADMAETTYGLEGDVLADGRYSFRVIASDKASNSAASAREAELISAPVEIDNTPPVVTATPARRTGSSAEIQVTAEDRGSALRRCEYSLDAGPFTPVEAADGVTDSAREQFTIRLENLAAGEHLVSIRAFDSAGNAGLARVVVR